MLTAIVGVNWGDEGKGRMVDLLSEEQDIVIRYQGGNNAGHTVVNDRGKFILNLLPSGIFRPEVVNVMGGGMVVDIAHLCAEIERLSLAGVEVTPERLKISDKAMICLPYHVLQDCLEEDRLGDAKYGSTRRGIAPAYGDKYLKKGIRMGDLLYPKLLKKQLAGIVQWKNLTIKKAYRKDPIEPALIFDWLMEHGRKLTPFITDTGEYLENAIKDGKRLLFEAQLGALRDIDFGIYPYTSSSNTIAAYAPIGAGIPGHKLDHTVGVMKAYSTCVGEGPFVAEMFGEEAALLREAGGEYGAATGRPRRVGGFDVPASRYGVRVQGADELALTKLDVLSGMEKIPVCVAYEIGGMMTREFPTGHALSSAKPLYEYVPGWEEDIGGCRRVADLPEAARRYVELLERAVSCPVRYISVGPDRDAYIDRNK